MKHGKSIRILVIALLALGVLASVTPALAAGLGVDNTYGNYSTVFTVVGSGFNPNEKVSVWVGLSNMTTVALPQTTADGSGNIEFTVTPQAAWPAGEVIAVAHGQSSGREYSVKLTLTNSSDDSGSGSSTNVDSGLTIYYQGSGYQNGERVATWYQSPVERGTSTAHALPDVFADASGNVSFVFTVQPNWVYGQYHITAQGTQSQNVTYNTFSFFGTISDHQAFTVGGGAVANGQWRGEYYDNISLSGSPVLVRTDPAVDFNWGVGSPAANIPADNFSVRWTSTQHISTAGNYTLTATADDGVRVWVDGQLVIDAWVDQPATTYTANLSLGAGDHTVRVEYYEHTLYALVSVSLD